MPPRLPLCSAGMAVELRHLRAFATIADEGTVSAAARRLAITQPALSRPLAQFERALGVRLVERSTTSLALTPEGRALLPKVLAALAGVDDRLAGLNRGQVDVAFLRGNVEAAGVRTQLLHREPRVAALPEDHPLAGRPATTMAELAAWPLVVNPTSGTVSELLWPAGARPPGPRRLPRRRARGRRRRPGGRRARLRPT